VWSVHLGQWCVVWSARAAAGGLRPAVSAGRTIPPFPSSTDRKKCLLYNTQRHTQHSGLRRAGVE
jgi:hypothetical protein